MANVIKEFATKQKKNFSLEIEGDLAKQMGAHNPLITKDQAIWCSNFESENPSCPYFPWKQGKGTLQKLGNGK
jgi:hypothetical protein